MQAWTVWVVDALFFLFGLSAAGGVIISTCGNDKITEVVADQETYFTCTAEGRVQWRLQFNSSDKTELLATCEYICQRMTNYSGLLVASIKEVHHSSSMTIRAVKRSNIVKIMNGSLLCVLVNEKSQHMASTGCGLSYVYPPDGVSCMASNDSWSVTVSCVFGSVYSSRGHYTCQLHREKPGSNREALELVSMMTSPTSESISENEVKVSGSCQFNTTLPAQEGHYRFHVSVSPGGRTYTANYTADLKWITAERPTPPNVSCDPHPNVLENTDVTCRCSSTNLGQPLGRLTWVVGNKINKGTPAKEDKQVVTPDGLLYTQMLTLSDHGRTWFRCDVIWGTEDFPGETYTAHVGYAAKQPSFSLNGQDRNLTVTEGDQVQFVCDSDGRPVPQVTIHNNDNDTALWREMSPVNVTFVARCNDSATYTCSAWNEVSIDVVTPLNMTLDVLCKPRSLLPSRLLVFTDDILTRLHFDVIAKPPPQQCRLWLNTSNGNYSEIGGSQNNITCRAGKNRRYLSRCTLTVFNTSSLSMTGIYLLQIINEVGKENFTVEIKSEAALEDYGRPPANLLAVGGGVMCAVALAAFLLVIVVRKIKKDHDRKQGLNKPEVIPVASQQEPSQDPLHTVMDKTQRKASSQPAHAVTTEEDIHRPRTAGVTGTVPGCSKETEAVYAVVDKVRSKSPGLWNQVRLSLGIKPRCSQQPEGAYAAVDKVRNKSSSKRHKAYKNRSLRTNKCQRNKVHLTEDESCYMNYDPTPIYQNDVQLAVRPTLSQNEATDKKWTLPSLASRCHTADDGRWVNHQGLTYTLPVFDVSDDVGRRPVTRDDGIDYCTLRVL